VLGYRDRGQQSPNRDNAKIRLYTKSSRLRLLLLTRLRRRKTREEKTREEKNAKVQRREGAKNKEVRKVEEGGRKERSVSHPSSLPFVLPVSVLVSVLSFAPLHLCVKFRLILSVFSATSAGLLSYRPSGRVRCGTTRSEASAPTWMPSRSQGRLLWVRSPPSRPDAVRA